MEKFGLLWWATALGVSLVVFAILGGAFVFFKEDYERRLGRGHAKPVAIVLALWDYLVVDLLRQLVGGAIVLAVLVFVLGGLIGLLLIGWERLIAGDGSLGAYPMAATLSLFV